MLAKEASRGRQPRRRTSSSASLSHELRTPLTPVLAAIGLLENDPHLPPEMREQVSMIRRNIETEARLVDDLLDVTRIARGKMQLHFEVVDAHAVAAQRVDDVPDRDRRQGPGGDAGAAAKDYHVWADSGAAPAGLLNLLSNAVKFTPEERHDHRLARPTTTPGTLEIEVSDTGIGIEPERAAATVQRVRAGRASVHDAVRRAGAGAVDRAIAGRDARRNDQAHSEACGQRRSRSR